LVSQIGIHYRHGSLSSHAGDEDFAVKAGDRMPYFLVDDASIYDRLRQPKFHWLVFLDEDSDYREWKAEIENAYTELMDVNIIRLHPAVSKIFGAHTPCCMLLRPDNHIGFITTETSPDRIRTYLDTRLRHAS